jgi:hypothetical protein
MLTLHLWTALSSNPKETAQVCRTHPLQLTQWARPPEQRLHRYYTDLWATKYVSANFIRNIAAQVLQPETPPSAADARGVVLPLRRVRIILADRSVCRAAVDDAVAVKPSVNNLTSIDIADFVDLN